ncbi:TonB-dependent receptor [Sphingobacterium hungaricum]|uniref:TonB-dependent Receptor Plug Domain n=1 Tax=Sphingobacterium hungaricum TaxID=2082723 RepID=A0A928UXV1_9SPHI|nr:TonB-dependent receptor [Sphingobacterium hungaricum]MBE8712787.1 hypothetical protein [Sphingobacterium hungaricum]
MIFYRIVLTFLILFGCEQLLAQQSNSITIKGTVIDEKGLPISLANIYCEETFTSISSDVKGNFSLQIPKSYDQVNLRFTYVGLKTATINIKKQNYTTAVSVTLLENSLTLDEIQVNPRNTSNKNSISSIEFDEEAIERVQAFSLMDVLNTLPGKQMTPPNINAPQTLTLRNTLTENSNTFNNSLGIPIIIDGVAISNDANMQSRPIGQRGMSGSALPAPNPAFTADVAFRGIDLREIPVESIEKIEVIQGVASAEYGELTDGAILIERKAGKSPMQFTTNINGGSSNYSLNKGFNLPKNWGGLTTDLNFANSNSNPRDKVQQYNRYGASVRWNTVQFKNFRNKLSIDYSKRVDNSKLDPDDGSQRKYYSRESRMRFSNNSSFRVNSKFLDDINLTLSYSEGNQETYSQYLLNQAMKPYTAKDTTGIYEGTVINGTYMAYEELVGNPVSMSGNLRLTSRFHLGKTNHNLSYGVNSNYSNNGGKGIVLDPERPRFVNLGDQNLRPYSYELIPAMVNSGVYFMDNFNYKLFGKAFNSNFGIRFDSQNGSLSTQPRLNTQVILSKNWNIAVAYGISSKSPTLAHRYPPPSWIDVPLIFAANSNASLYLVYTERIETANENLKPSKSSQAEFTVNYKNDLFSSRINGYFKDNRNGFNTLAVYKPFTLPTYTYQTDPTTGGIIYSPTGRDTTYYNYSYNKMDNSISSYTYGVDWSINFKEIKQINTTVSSSTSYILSRQNNRVLTMTNLTTPIQIGGKYISYALYEPFANDKIHVLTSKLNTTTHIPKLGFVVMTNTDVFWMNHRESQYSEKFQPAIGYLDNQMNQVLFAEGDVNNIPPRDVQLTETTQRIIYANFSMSVAKEISKKIRIAITAYNTWNLHPESSYVNPENGVETITSYNSPLSITGGITIKL